MHLHCWQQEYERLRWAEKLPRLPYPPSGKRETANPKRRRLLEKILAGVGRALEESPAATAERQRQDLICVSAAVDWANRMLRATAAKVCTEPFPTAARAADDAAKEYARQILLRDDDGRLVPAEDVSPDDRVVVGLVVREIERLDKAGMLGKRPPFGKLAKEIAAKALDVPVHSISRTLAKRNLL